MANCETCGGDGRVTCPDCGGAKGEFVHEYHDGESTGKTWVDCPGCNGEGVQDCPECDGTGEVSE